MGNLMRWDIINQLIQANNYKSYLEIGYYKGWSFDQVKCWSKIAVDPNPSKTVLQEQLGYEAQDFQRIDGRLESVIKMTSDDFFKKNIDLQLQFDVIFIDGLHEAEQVYRDIENSLRHLNEGGTIVLHDCNPPLYEHTTTGIDGCWTGDTYKGVIKASFDFPVCLRTVDTDWGVGIITRGYQYAQVDDPEPDYEKFSAYRDEYLNLISPKDFEDIYIKPKQNV